MREKCRILCMGFMMCCQAVSADECQLDAVQVTYDQNGCVNDNYFVFGEFLYLQPFVDGLEYGYSEIDTVDFSVPIVGLDAKVKDLSYDWSPGFRVGGGYKSHCCWGLAVEWTHLNGHADGSFQTPNFPQEFFNIQWVSDFAGARADRARAKWSLNYNVVDLSIGNEFSIGNCVCLRPYIGVRGAWINQRYHTDYHSLFMYSVFGPGEGVIPFDSDLNIKQNFSAGGIRTGMGFNWDFACGWSLCGNVSASLLYAHYKYRMSALGATFDTRQPTPSLIPVDGTLEDQYNRVRANFEESIGLQWTGCFWQYQVFVKIGYELSQWIDQNDFINVYSSVESRPLNLSGETTEDIQPNLLLHQGRSLMLQGVTARFALLF